MPCLIPCAIDQVFIVFDNISTLIEKVEDNSLSYLMMSHKTMRRDIELSNFVTLHLDDSDTTEIGTEDSFCICCQKLNLFYWNNKY